MIHRNMMVSRCETWWHDGEWVGTVGTRWVKHVKHEACTLCSSLVTNLLVFMKFSNRQATLVSFKEFVLSFRSATGILPCSFRSPSHCSQESHLPWAAASDTGDHWTSRHPACTSESDKKEMVWNSLMNLIRHNGLRGFEWKDFRAFTARFSSLKKQCKMQRLLLASSGWLCCLVSFQSCRCSSLKLDENVYQQKVFQTANAFGCQYLRNVENLQTRMFWMFFFILSGHENPWSGSVRLNETLNRNELNCQENVQLTRDVHVT